MAKVSLTKVNTDSNIMLAFLNRLAFTLSVEDSQRRKNTVLLLDSASYHTSAETRLHFVKLGLTVLFTAPYTYDFCPDEFLFAYLKKEEINPSRLACGKK